MATSTEPRIAYADKEFGNLGVVKGSAKLFSIEELLNAIKEALTGR